ncbi:MAG: hypothetical protein JWP81_3750 [Ferruginibacter sp.]|nr:hypothetical protein [Ferruginibacter sp.]
MCKVHIAHISFSPGVLLVAVICNNLYYAGVGYTVLKSACPKELWRLTYPYSNHNKQVNLQLSYTIYDD